ncbi:MAG: helix-turn-helix transcriptional regulator [Verrucomicrobiota bacterium]
MSYFANALSASLSKLEWSQTHLAELTGLQRPHINRYVRGRATADSETLVKLLTTLPQPYNAHLLAAYLRDAIPAGFESLVYVAENNENLHETPFSLPENLDPVLKKTICRLSIAAGRHTEIRDMLVQFDKLTRPKH